MDWQETLFLAACVRVGVFDALDKTHTASASALSADLGLDARATAEALSVLCELGYLKRLSPSGDGPLSHEFYTTALYRLSEKGAAWAAATSERAALLHRAETIRDWTEMPQVLKSGEPVLAHPRDGERFEIFLGAMDSHGRAGAARVAEEVIAECPGARTLVDLGGATGAHSMAFAAAGLQVTMVDTPNTIEKVAGHLEAADIATHAADFMLSLPAGPFDIAFLSNVTHIYSPDENMGLLRGIHGILTRGGHVILRDSIRGATPDAGMVALNMLAHTESGSTYSFEEYGSWLRTAGFREVRLSSGKATGHPGGMPLIIARR